MYRIILRGKRKDNGMWVYGFSHPSLREGVCLIEGRYNLYEVERKTAGRYINMNDLNNKKIFRDDIIKFPDQDTLYIVTFDQKLYDFVGVSICDNSNVVRNLSSSIVIGNVHDNPELLKKELEVGQWISKDSPAKRYACSICGGLIELPQYTWYCYYNYCPCCGKKMINQQTNSKNRGE